MGLSYLYVTDDGTSINKNGGRFLICRNHEVLCEIPTETVEGVVLLASVQVTSQAIIEFLRRGIPVSWVSRTGKYYGKLSSYENNNVFKQERQIQVQSSDFPLALSKKVIAAKAHNQIIVLRRYNRVAQISTVDEAISHMIGVSKNIHSAWNREQLMGYEGIMAKDYFRALGQIVPPDFSFERRSRRPPEDAFNAMLSLGYTLVSHELYTVVATVGLHPYFGFLHALRNHHPALISDLLEEWRAVLVDSLVMSLIVRNRILPDCFEAFLTKEKCEKMAQEASQIINISTDSLRIYVLLDRMSVRSWGVGDCHTEEVIIC